MGLGVAYQKTTLRTKIGGGLGQGSIQTKFGTPYIFLQSLKLTTSNVVHKLGLGLAYQKTTFKTKIEGGLGQGTSKIIGTPHLFLQPLKLATSNLVCNLGLGLAYQKTTFKTKIGGGLGQGNIQQKLGPPIYFCNWLKKLVHNRLSGLPCETQVLRLN